MSSQIISTVCVQVSDLWEQLELTSELEFDLQGNVDWGRKRLVVLFGPGLITLVLLM